MLRATLSPEWAESLDREQILKYNPNRGIPFLDMVRYRELGGYAMSVYGAENRGTFNILDARGRQQWRRFMKIDLSFDQPAVIGIPVHTADFQTMDGRFNTRAMEQMDAFFRATTPSGHGEVLGNEKVMLPLAGIALSDYSYFPHDHPGYSKHD